MEDLIIPLSVLEVFIQWSVSKRVLFGGNICTKFLVDITYVI